MNEVVTLEPWSPWPLVIPAIVLVAAVMASIVGTRLTFSGSVDLSGGELPPIAFQAERDGERVRGVLKPLGGDRWEVAEVGG
jgi:hypothetical protein